MKRIILFLMVISIIFTTACGINIATNTDKEQEQFTYEAKEIYSANGSKGISSIAMGSNGELALYNYYEKKIYIFDKSGARTGEIEAGENWDGVLAFDKDNKLYVLLQSLKKNESKENVLLKRQLRIYDVQSNTLKEQSGIVEIKGHSKYLIEEVIDKIEADSQGNIYCLKVNGEVEALDTKLKNITTLQGRKCLDIDIDEEDNILAQCYESGSKIYVEKISGKDHKSIWKKDYNQNDIPESIYYNIKNKTLYELTPQGIASCDGEGNAKSNIAKREQLEGLDSILRFIVDEEENIYARGKSGSTQKILKFTRTENNEERIGDKKEIVVYSYYPFDSNASKYIANIIKKFEKQYSNISVRFIAHEKLYDAQNLSNLPYIQLLNTEIMAGKGPDILCGYYPAREYIDRGILEKLDEMLGNDSKFDMNDYYRMPIEGSKYKDSLYIMPVFYSVNFYMGNDKLLKELEADPSIYWRWSDLHKIKEKIKYGNKNYYVLRKYDYDEYFWFENIIRCDIDYYIDWDGRKANFDTKEFRNVLELLKSIKNKFMYPEHTGSDEKGLDTARKNILFYAISTGSYHWLNISNPYDEGMRLLPWPWGEYTDTRTFDAYNVSINSRSQNKEEAWEFVKYLLTEDIQSYLSENNFVVNRKADEKRIDAFAEELEKYNLLGDDNIKAINDIKNSLNKNSVLQAPDELFNTIWEEIKAYLSGSKSAEETAKTIQNKVELYLNE